MRVLVTGARGFVGGRLLPRLEACGASVVAVDREIDVSDAEAMDRVVAKTGPDAIVHLAALSFVPDTIDDPFATFRVNFLGTRNVLEAARRRAPRARLLIVGSGHVYGTAAPEAPPFAESAPLRPASPYARTKAAADLLAAEYARDGLDVVRARPFNHTGRGRPDRFVESSVARQLVEIERGVRPPELRVGNLDAVRDFLDVEDVVSAYLRLLDREVERGAYNVASGVGRSVRELVDALTGLSRAGGIKIEVDPGLVRPTDGAVGDAGRLRALGWAPRVPIETTLRDLLEGWRAALP